MDPHSLSLISTLLLVFSAALLGGVAAKLAKQPMVLGYIGAGILVGNLFPRVTDPGFLNAIAQSGVTLLLFTLGVEFSFHRMKKLMKSIGWAAGLQIVLVMLLILLLSLSLGIPFLTSLFLAVAASLSSSAVIMKILTERGELDTGPGETMMSWSVIQDLGVVPVMIILPAIVMAGAGGAQASLPAVVLTILLTCLKAAITLVLIIFLGRKGIPALLNAVAGIGSREIFVLTTVGLAFLCALLTFVFGLSAALGAFIAGLLISETSQNHAIFAEIRPLRDLFAVVFFVSLGMGLPLSIFLGSWQILLILTAAVILIKWGVVMGLMRFLGYHRKTAFLVAVGLIPMSEFGFIIASQGVQLHAIGGNDYALIVALTFVTILLSAPLTGRGQGLYYALQRALGGKWPHLFHSKEELAALSEDLPYRDHIVLCGYGRVGKYIGRALEMADIPFVVVDYNNATIARLREKGIPVVYGDPADKDVLDYAQVDYAKAVIIAIPDRHTQELIIANSQMHTCNFMRGCLYSGRQHNMPTIKETAADIYKSLMSDERYQHGGPDSRGMQLDTHNVLTGLEVLSYSIKDVSARALIDGARMILWGVGDNGIALLVKSGTEVELRGIPDEIIGKPSYEDAELATMHMANRVRITTNGDKPRLYIDMYPRETELNEAFNIINESLDENVLRQVIGGILGVVKTEVDKAVPPAK